MISRAGCVRSTVANLISCPWISDGLVKVAVDAWMQEHSCCRERELVINPFLRTQVSIHLVYVPALQNDRAVLGSTEDGGEFRIDDEPPSAPNWPAGMVAGMPNSSQPRGKRRPTAPRRRLWSFAIAWMPHL